MVERHTVVAEIAQCLTLYKRIDWRCAVRPNLQRFTEVKRLLRKVLKDSRAFSVKCVSASIGALPPLLGHIDLGPREFSVSTAVGQAGQTKQVPRHGSSWMRLGQQRAKFRGDGLELTELRGAQLAYRHRICVPKFLECHRGQPVRFVKPEVPSGCCDDIEPLHLGRFAHKMLTVRRSSSLKKSRPSKNRVAPPLLARSTRRLRAEPSNPSTDRIAVHCSPSWQASRNPMRMTYSNSTPLELQIA